MARFALKLEELGVGGRIGETKDSGGIVAGGELLRRNGIDLPAAHQGFDNGQIDDILGVRPLLVAGRDSARVVDRPPVVPVAGREERVDASFPCGHRDRLQIGDASLMPCVLAVALDGVAELPLEPRAHHGPRTRVKYLLLPVVRIAGHGLVEKVAVVVGLLKKGKK